MKNKLETYIPVRFIEIFNRVLHNKVTCIQAPAGYGKTTLAKHWGQLSKRTFMWFEIKDSFNNPKNLLANLTKISTESTKDDTVIIIDNVHLLRKPEALAELKRWLIQAPSRNTFILLSRMDLSVIKNDSDLQQETFVLDTEYLRFTQEEVEYWLFQQYIDPLDLTENQKTSLYKITEGCPALLQLSYHHYLRHDGPLLDNRGRVTPILESYVRHEWLEQLTGDTLRLLRPLGIPPYLSFDFARELLQMEMDPLFNILEKHLLITKFLNKNQWFHRFHPLLRAVIMERFTFIDHKKTMDRAILFLEKEGLYKEAVEIAIQGSNSKMAIKYIKKIAPDILLLQDYQTIQDWFERLDSKELYKDKEILSLYHWVLTLSKLTNVKEQNECHMIINVKKDQWTPFIQLNHSNMPFIQSHLSFEDNMNKIISKYQISTSQDDSLAFNHFRQLVLAEVLYEQNYISDSRRNLEKVWLAIKSNRFPGISIPALWLELLCHQSEHNIQQVHFLVEEIYYRSLQTSIPVWQRIGKASKTYVQLKEGYYDEAEEWAHEQKRLLNRYWNEWTSFEYFMLARALLAFQDEEEASYLLNRMITSKSLGKDQGTHLKRRILQTITAIKLEQESDARFYLKDALEIGYNCGFTRSFIDEDPTLFLAFSEVQKDIPDHLLRYSNKLLRLVNKEELKEIKVNPKMKEALTLREIEILKHIQNGLSNQSIGERLNIKEGTVKSHLNRIFKKLNVKNRVEAITIAKKQLML